MDASLDELKEQAHLFFTYLVTPFFTCKLRFFCPLKIKGPSEAPRSFLFRGSTIFRVLNQQYSNKVALAFLSKLDLQVNG